MLITTTVGLFLAILVAAIIAHALREVRREEEQAERFGRALADVVAADDDEKDFGLLERMAAAPAITVRLSVSPLPPPPDSGVWAWNENPGARCQRREVHERGYWQCGEWNEGGGPYCARHAAEQEHDG